MKTPRLPRRRLRDIAIRLIVAYPICFYLYGSLGAAFFCVRNFTDVCIPMIMFSPVFLIIGPLGHEDEDPPNAYLRVLIVALVVVTIWTLHSLWRQRARVKQ